MASSAEGDHEGFLERGVPRESVGATDKDGERSFIVCENVDDSQSHVLSGPLRQRV